MSTQFNDITGDNIASKQNSDKFRSGWDAIWVMRMTRRNRNLMGGQG